MMADRSKLHVVQPSCPPALVRGVEREMELRLRAVGLELSKFGHVAQVDLNDEDVFTELASAAAHVHMARLAIARRKEPRG